MAWAWEWRSEWQRSLSDEMVANVIMLFLKYGVGDEHGVMAGQIWGAWMQCTEWKEKALLAPAL